MSIATPADTISINARLGDKSPDDIQAWLDSFEGELLLPWRLSLPSITLPLDSDPDTSTLVPELRETIRLAEMFAGAALIEGAPEIGQSPDQMAVSFNFYMSEYKLRRDRIQALTAPQLIAMGVPYIADESTGTGSIGASGLTRARNRRYGRSSYSIDWPDAYPFYNSFLP